MDEMVLQKEERGDREGRERTKAEESGTGMNKQQRCRRSRRHRMGVGRRSVGGREKRDGTTRRPMLNKEDGNMASEEYA